MLDYNRIKIACLSDKAKYQAFYYNLMSKAVAFSWQLWLFGAGTAFRIKYLTFI